MKQYPADRIFNVGVFSHGGAGKTTLIEAMLFDTGAITRRGRVSEGTTVSDSDPEEIKRHTSLTNSVIPIEYKDRKINFIDTPDYADFGGDVRSAMRVVESAIIVIDAAAGVEVGTQQVWENAEENNLPRLIFMNKMDRENADFRGALAALHEAWGKRVAPLQFPIGQEQDFKGIVNLLDNKAFVFNDNRDGGFEEQDIAPELAEDVAYYRRSLVDVIAEHNEELMMRYLEDEPISDEELHAELYRCIEDGSVIPMVCGAAYENRGVQTLLDTIIEFLPPAAERNERGTRAGEEVEVTADPDGALVALAFKTQADPHVGRVTWFRVFSGTMSSSSQVANASKGQDERIGQLFYSRGKEHINTDTVAAGDIGGVAKLATVETGDTISSTSEPIVLPGISFPESSYSVALHPHSQSDLDKLSQALTRLQEEDPSLRVSRDPQTGETIISGMGEPHVQIALERMARRSGVNVDMRLPRVAYRETITAKTTAEYKHKKQTGGAGQYGHVKLALEPLPDQDFEFTEKVVGGAVPRNFYPAVEKGVREALEEGPLAGYPVVNVHATLFDGSYHAVDSNEMAFKIAAKEAFKRGVLDGHPTLLEPILKLSITVAENFTGDVMSDLNTKRGQVTGMNSGDNGTTTIEAEVPAAEVQRYATDLRAMTQGRGTFTSEFAYYQPVPAHLAERIAAESNGAKENGTH
ncbi:MAG TPA: elongation factor G [Thermomicrobiales bacterium]|nr:elongation factor G [Thermomicrobiales bacterium]